MMGCFLDAFVFQTCLTYGRLFLRNGSDGFFSGCIFSPSVSDVWQTGFEHSGLMCIFMDAFVSPPCLT